jgi:hypothetical protein
MSTFAFDAACVAIDQPDGEFDLVGFADNAQDPESYLILQRALEFDEQDISLGMNTYHVEWCDQEYSGYGGISRAMLTPCSIQFVFDTMGIGFLGGLEALKISLRLQHGQFAELSRVLGRIFEGSDCLFVADA